MISSQTLFWTGSTGGGLVDSNCNDWTSSNGNDIGVMSDPSLQNYQRLLKTTLNSTCDLNRHLICLGRGCFGC
jgi:hypothetical protein